MAAQNNFLRYKNQEGNITVDALIQNETIWLTINQMAQLFGIDKSGISRHIKNVFDTQELQEQATVAKFATVQNEGGRTVKRNLDMIISEGYSVNSLRGTHFRIWATQQLKELIVIGFDKAIKKLKP